MHSLTYIFLPSLLNSAPTADIESPEEYRKVGEELILKCNVNGLPQPTISWWYASPNRSHQLNETSDRLVIKNVVMSSGGNYTCSATNALGTATDMAQVNMVISSDNRQGSTTGSEF